jgi:FKBP-type peptidyl-prolyl cis-trans isomerase FkpA
MKKLLTFITLTSAAFGAAWLATSTVGVHPADSSPGPVFHERFEAALKELKIEELKPGRGDSAQPGRKVTIHYVETLMDGTRIDSTYDRKEPLVFTMGRAQALPGLEKGIEGMHLGAKRRLTVPSFLAYGSKPVGDLVPANSDLRFEVELLGVGETQPAKPIVKPVKTTARGLPTGRKLASAVIPASSLKASSKTARLSKKKPK